MQRSQQATGQHARSPQALLARQLVAVLQAPEVKAKLADLAITPAADTSPAALGAIKQSQLARIGKVIEATKK